MAWLKLHKGKISSVQETAAKPEDVPFNEFWDGDDMAINSGVHQSLVCGLQPLRKIVLLIGGHARQGLKTLDLTF